MTVAHEKHPSVRKSFDYLDDAMREACLAVLESGNYYLGPENDAFEEAACDYLGVGQAVAVNSGTSAMFLILKALGIGSGDEVIVPAFGFVTLAEAVAVVGARARFVDIETDTYNLDPEKLAGALTERTRAIVPAHKYGHPADMEAIDRFAEEHGLRVVEDCCHALGARYRGRFAGTLGVAGFTSFAGKSISVCGLGGMIVTTDDQLAQEVRLLRDHGRPRSKGVRFYEITRIGYNLRLSEIHAAIGRVQLSHLEEWNRRRREISAYYNRAFGEAGVPLRSPRTLPGVDHAFLHHTVLVDASHRDELRAFLADRGIETAILYPTALHLLPPYREAWGHKEGEFPVTERVTREILTLPNHPGLSESMRAKVVSGVLEFFEDSHVE